MNDNDDYRITIRPLKSSVPLEHRLRSLLKGLLRKLDLQCIEIVAIDRVTRKQKTKAKQ